VFVCECVANITELLHVWRIYLLKGHCAAEGYSHEDEKQVSWNNFIILRPLKILYKFRFNLATNLNLS